MLIALAAFALGMSGHCQDASQQDQAELLADVTTAHRATREAYRTLKCLVEYTTKAGPNGNQAKIYRGKYVRDGETIRLEQEVDSQKRDIYVKDGLIKGVFNQNVSKDKKIVSASQRAAPSRSLGMCDAWERSHFALGYVGSIDRFPFEVLVARADRVEKTVKVQHNGKNLVLVHLVFAAVEKDPKLLIKLPRRDVLLYFDPARNYLISKWVQLTPVRSGARPEDGLRSESVVIGWQEFEGGLFFPTRCESTFTAPGKPEQNSSTTTEFSEVRVNDPIGQEVFDFRFPNGIYLADSIRGTNYQVDSAGIAIGPEKLMGKQPPPPIAKTRIAPAASVPRMPSKNDQTTDFQFSWMFWVSVAVFLCATVAWVAKRRSARNADA